MFCRILTGDDYVKIESYLKVIENYFECGDYDRAHQKLSDAIKLRRTNKITDPTIDLQLKVRRINSRKYFLTFLTVLFSPLHRSVGLKYSIIKRIF